MTQLLCKHEEIGQQRYTRLNVSCGRSQKIHELRSEIDDIRSQDDSAGIDYEIKPSWDQWN